MSNASVPAERLEALADHYSVLAQGGDQSEREQGIYANIEARLRALLSEVREEGKPLSAGDVFCSQCGQYHASLIMCPNLQITTGNSAGADLTIASAQGVLINAPTSPASAGTEGLGLRDLLERALDWIHREHDDCDDGCDARALATEIESALALVEGEKK